MAEALEKVEERLNCSICHDTFTDPKLLQCFHVYCQKCLQALVDRYKQDGLTCPICRKVTPIPDVGVVGLQPAFYINHLFEIRASLLKTESPASHYEEHVPTNLNPDKKARHCFDHEGKELDLYCEKCGELICWKCAYKGKHIDHNAEELAQAFEKYKEEVRAALEPMGKQVTTAEKAQSKLEERRKEISYHGEDIKYDIRMAFGRLRKVLDDREAELISRQDQMTQVKLKGLDSQMDQVETTLAQLKNCIHFMRESLKPGNEEDMMMMKSNTMNQVKELITPFKPHYLKPCAKADITFIDLPDQLSELCNNHGEVFSPGLPAPSKCIIDEGPKCAWVDEKSVVILGAFNCDGKPCEEPISSFECEIVSEITGTRENCSVERIGLDQYEISYQPTIKGRHQLHIKAEGQHIRGSPFSVTVKLPVEKLGTPILPVLEMRKPSAVAVNRRGEVVVAEEGGHCVSVFSDRGKIPRSFGGHGSDEGQFNPPRGVEVDGDGNILVADSWNHRIQKLTAEGEFLVAVGAEGSGPLQFHLPTDIAFNTKNSRVYIADQDNHRIEVLHSDLTFAHAFGKKGSGEGEFNRPWGVACDSTGKVYVADRYNNRIQVFTDEGNFLAMFERRGEDVGDRLNSPYGIAIDDNNMVYVSESENHRVSVFTSEGQFVTSFGRKGEGPGEFRWPHGITVDNTGFVYVCDFGNNRVQIF